MRLWIIAIALAATWGCGRYGPPTRQVETAPSRALESADPNRPGTPAPAAPNRLL